MGQELACISTTFTYRKISKFRQHEEKKEKNREQSQKPKKQHSWVTGRKAD
jgi:hypothetical protein